MLVWTFQGESLSLTLGVSCHPMIDCRLGMSLPALPRHNKELIQYQVFVFLKPQ